jgi:hypothetical protein
MTKFNKSLFKKRPVVKKNKDAVQDRKIAKLQRLVKPEFKNFTVNATTDSIPQRATNAFGAAVIVNVPVGQGGSSRIGDRIAVYGIDIAMMVQDCTTHANPLRWMIFEDRGFDSNLATPNYPLGGDILQSYNVTDTSVRNALSSYNMDTVQSPFDNSRKKRYRILYDNTYLANQYTITQRGYCHIKRLKFKKPIICQYSGDDVRGGTTLMFGVFPGYSTTSGSNPAFTWRSTVYYTDQ